MIKWWNHDQRLFGHCPRLINRIKKFGQNLVQRGRCRSTKGTHSPRTWPIIDHALIKDHRPLSWPMIIDHWSKPITKDNQPKTDHPLSTISRWSTYDYDAINDDDVDNDDRKKFFIIFIIMLPYCCGGSARVNDGHLMKK